MSSAFDYYGPVPPREIIVVNKGWGHEEWLVNGQAYCGKNLFFNKGKRCSYHYHKLKTETFYLHYGKIEVVYNIKEITYPVPKTEEEIMRDYALAERIVLVPPNVFHLPRYMRHQMIALENSMIVEFSTQHFEDDSIRLIKGD